MQRTILVVDSLTLVHNAPIEIESIFLPVNIPVLPVGSDIWLNAPSNWKDRIIPATITRYSYQQKDNTVCVHIEFDKQQALFANTADYIVEGLLKHCDWQKFAN